MANYQDEEMEQMKNVLRRFNTPEKFKVPEHLKSERVPNLPSDTALESNKERQDKSMKNALETIGMAINPVATAGMTAGIAAARALKNRKKRTEDGGETTSDGMKKGGKVSSASKRADGIAQRGKTRGRIV